jgi:RNA polymerase sigma-70 factor (ECF subfamily)
MLTVDPDMAQDTDGMNFAPPPEPPGLGSESTPGGASASTDWVSLVERIRSGSEEGMTELYRLFSKGIRFYLCRQLGPQELDDKVHDTFLIVVQAIRRGDLREPERLMGFVRTVVRRQVAAYIDDAVQTRREQADIESGVIVVDANRNPEEKAIGRQNEDLMVQVLRSMSKRDREILTRFYLQEQTQHQICTDMNLSETQFRLLKSRAKARFGELGKRKLQKKPVGPEFLRTIMTAAHYVY